MSERYLILSDVAIRVLSIPAISAASERNWSTFGFIHLKLRNRLHKKRVEKIVYLHWNLRILCAIGRLITLDDWVEKVLQNKAIGETAKVLDNEQEVEAKSDFSNIDLQPYSDLEESDGELDKF